MVFPVMAHRASLGPTKVNLLLLIIFPELESFKLSRTEQIMNFRIPAPQLADLVDVPAVDFDIVDRLCEARKRNRQNDRKAIETLECFD